MSVIQKGLMMNAIQISQNFSLHEFQCPCCKRVMLHERLLEYIQGLRSAINSTIMITSGYRCPTYNQKIGGALRSYHMYGLAVDIITPEYPLLEAYYLAQDLGFTGFGFYEKRQFIHLDIRPGQIFEFKGDELI